MDTRKAVRAGRPPGAGLRAQMNRVLTELRRVRKSADADAVHDLRVAIRRCRSVATAMQEWMAIERGGR